MRPKLKHSLPQQRGISLIEVMVSMVIFSVGILGMTALQVRALQQTHDQNQRDVAIWKAQAFIDRISLNNSAASLTIYTDSVNDETFCNNDPTEICSETFDTLTNTEVPAATCSASEMAIYDTWEILCADNDGLNDELVTLKQPSMTCQNVPCVIGDQLRLILTWESYASRADPRLTGNTTIVRGDDSSAESVLANLERYQQVFTP